MKTETITLRVWPELKYALKEKADAANITFSHYITQGLQSMVKEGEIPPEIYVNLVYIYNLAKQYDNRMILEIVERMIKNDGNGKGC